MEWYEEDPEGGLPRQPAGGRLVRGRGAGRLAVGPSGWVHCARLTARARTRFGVVRVSVAEATQEDVPRLELDLVGRF